MKLLHSSFILVLLVLVSPVLSACQTVVTTSAAPPQPTQLPTAIVASAPTADAVVPTSMPTLPPVEITPPALPPPPTPTLQPSGPGGLPFPQRTGRLEFGVAAHLFYTNRDAPLIKARDAGFGWIRQQIHWRNQEGPAGNYAWGELETIINTVSAYKLKLMISIVRSPTFYTANGDDGMPANPKNMGDFVAALAKRYPGKIAAIEIWNEQTLAYENGGQVLVSERTAAALPASARR